MGKDVTDDNKIRRKKNFFSSSFSFNFASPFFIVCFNSGTVGGGQKNYVIVLWKGNKKKTLNKFPFV